MEFKVNPQIRVFFLFIFLTMSYLEPYLSAYTPDHSSNTLNVFLLSRLRPRLFIDFLADIRSNFTPFYFFGYYNDCYYCVKFPITINIIYINLLFFYSLDYTSKNYKIWLFFYFYYYYQIRFVF